MKKDNERKILRLLRNMEETTDKIFEVLHRIELKFIDDDIEKNSKKWEKDKNNIYESQIMDTLFIKGSLEKTKDI